MNAQTHRPIAILGAGAWGTALAQAIAQDGAPVVLWTHRPDHAEAMISMGENDDRLPGVPLEASITPTADLADIAACDIVLAVIPAQAARSQIAAAATHCAPETTVVSCAKGVERGSLKTMAAVMADVAPHVRPAVLSGPSFAHEVAAGKPAAVTLAAETLEHAAAIAQAIARPTFRLYLSDDIVGAEMGGAVKNVLAIACGIVDARSLGRSAHAGLITRGFAEMTRLAVAMGARPETLAGLSGLGDLVLTCSSPQSRNMSLGRALGSGRPVSDVLAGARALAEGAASAPAVVALAQQAGVDMPICTAVAAILDETISIDEAIEGLLSRPIKAEPI